MCLNVSRRGHDSYGEEEQQGWSQSDVASERYDQEEDDDGWVESESAYSQEEEDGRYGQQGQHRHVVPHLAEPHLLLTVFYIIKCVLT